MYSCVPSFSSSSSYFLFLPRANRETDRKRKRKIEKEKKETLYARAVMSERTRKADWSATKDDCIEDLRSVQRSLAKRSGASAMTALAAARIGFVER